MSVFSAVTGLAGTLSYYLPLLVVFVALAVVLLVFKLAGVKVGFLWKLLLNSLIGIAMLILFDALFAGYLKMSFFWIPVSWFTAGFAGVLGIPGVILLLILRYLIQLP